MEEEIATDQNIFEIYALEKNIKTDNKDIYSNNYTCFLKGELLHLTIGFNLSTGELVIGDFFTKQSIDEPDIQEELLEAITRFNFRKNKLMPDGIEAGTYLYADLPEVSFAAKVKNRQLNEIEENPLIL